MRSTIEQLIRYGMVGALSNIVGYILYLVITAAGTEHKLAMTITYALGLAQTFVLNRRWSFRYRGKQGQAFVRYCLVYVFGYLANFGALYFFVDRLGWPHEFVQAFMVFLVATSLFLLQKFWVFNTNPKEALH